MGSSAVRAGSIGVSNCCGEGPSWVAEFAVAMGGGNDAVVGVCEGGGGGGAKSGKDSAGGKGMLLFANSDSR